MSDLQTRLRRAFAAWGLRSLGDEAADEIDRLTAEVAELRQVLEDIAAAQPIWHGGVGRMPYEHLIGLIADIKAEAVAALTVKDTSDV